MAGFLDLPLDCDEFGSDHVKSSQLVSTKKDNQALKLEKNICLGVYFVKFGELRTIT